MATLKVLGYKDAENAQMRLCTALNRKPRTLDEKVKGKRGKKKIDRLSVSSKA